MKRFAVLLRPAANQVYFAASPKLMLAELDVLRVGGLVEALSETRATTIAKVPYLEFAAAELTERDLAWVSQLSSAHALFEVVGDALRPVPLPSVEVLDSDLVTIPKYRGKTNELFTKLLLNVAVFSSLSARTAQSRRLKLLDPMCGRGTTLSLGLLHGYDVTGLDVDAKACDAYKDFVVAWLKQKRLKHQVLEANKRKNATFSPKRVTVEFALDKEAFRGGEHLTMTVVSADTLRAGELLARASFDVIAADMPYGVQHGSHGERGAVSRAPVDLLAQALPGWTTLLRPGGAVALAFNTRVASRERMLAAFEGCGLEVLEHAPYDGFKHWVDQSITRDILVGRRPLRDETRHP